MMWYEEVSEGAHVGTTTHQGAPRGARPGGLCPPRAPPSDIICSKNSQISRKNHVKFSGHYEIFYFWVIFYCTGNSENRQNMACYFIEVIKIENRR